MTETPAAWWARQTPDEQQRYLERLQERDNLLMAARAALPFPPGPASTPQQPRTLPTTEQALDSVDELIRVGEPRMAWENLCHIARDVGASEECWGYLMQVRAMLGIHAPERAVIEILPEYALVLYELYERNVRAAQAAGTADKRTGVGATLVIESDAERMALWGVIGLLGQQLAAPFLPNYRELVAEAQEFVQSDYNMGSDSTETQTLPVA